MKYTIEICPVSFQLVILVTLTGRWGGRLPELSQEPRTEQKTQGMWYVHTANKFGSWNGKFSNQTSSCLFGVKNKKFLFSLARNLHITQYYWRNSVNTNFSTEFRQEVGTETITPAVNRWTVPLVVRTWTAVVIPTHGPSTTTVPPLVWTIKNSRWVY